jgi:hypothetical protein
LSHATVIASENHGIGAVESRNPSKLAAIVAIGAE